MSASVPFYLVDVFADTPLTGNPLAVVAEAERIQEPVMRSVAREFNQSETTFVLPPTRPAATWRLRSFTPAGAEVGGAGTTCWARGGGWHGRADRARRRRRGSGRAGVRGPHPAGGGEGAGRTPGGDPDRAGTAGVRAHRDRRDELAAALGFDRAAADVFGDVQAQVVSTGAAHLMVPARDRAVVDGARPDAPRLAAALARVGGEGCYLYCLDPVDPAAVAHARFFNPTVGISEDPATGSAAGPLVSRLVAMGVVPDGRPCSSSRGTPSGARAGYRWR